MSPFGVPVLRKFAKSSHVYTCHFGIEALMSHYLDKDFKAEYLEIPASVRSEEYYVKMMIAWFFATAVQGTGQCPAEKPRLARSLRKMGRTQTCPCATRRTSIYKGLATLPYKM